MEICQETIIILHGWASSKERWQVVKEKLQHYEEDRPRSIRIRVPDLPGFKLETSLDKVWNLDDYVKWLEDFCSDISGPFYLLGHSFGGRIAIKFAAKYPGKLKGLILVSSAGIKYEPRFKNLTFSAGAKKIKFIFLKIPLLKNYFCISRNFFYKYILRKTDYIKSEQIPNLKETFKNIIEEDLTPYLPQIKVPTLIIWGEKDKMTPLSDARLMNGKIPNSKLEILKNVGHSPHLETPEILAPKIADFINTNTRCL